MSGNVFKTSGQSRAVVDASLSWRCGNRVPPEPRWPDPSSHYPSLPDRRSDRPPETCGAPGTDTSEPTAQISHNHSQLEQKYNPCTASHPSQHSKDQAKTFWYFQSCWFTSFLFTEILQN